jgi:hypothetical protein
MNRLTPYYRGCYGSAEQIRQRSYDVLLFCAAISRIEQESDDPFLDAEGIAEMEGWAVDTLRRLGSLPSDYRNS